ncbi:hypothetical protein EI42_06454, partial [Thermosporothrix hazakensis]
WSVSPTCRLCGVVEFASALVLWCGTGFPNTASLQQVPPKREAGFVCPGLLGMPKIGTKPEEVPVREWSRSGFGGKRGCRILWGSVREGMCFSLRERDQEAVEAELASSGEQGGANADDEEETSSQVAVMRDGGALFILWRGKFASAWHERRGCWRRFQEEVMDKKRFQMLVPGSRSIGGGWDGTGSEGGGLRCRKKRNVGEIVGAVKAEKEKAGASQQREERGSDPSRHS